MSRRGEGLARHASAADCAAVTPDDRIDIMRIEDGRLAEYWVTSDGLALMAQLGALVSARRGFFRVSARASAPASWPTGCPRRP